MRNLLWIGLYLISAVNILAQESPEHVKKFYVGDDGKLFWQKDLPVYLFASTKPDGADAQALKSEKTPDYSNPMYLDTEGVNYIRSKWAIDENGEYASPQQEVEFEIYADGRVPTTLVSFASEYKSTLTDGPVYGQGLLVSASSKDGMSGVDDTYYAHNEAAYQSFNEALSFSEGKHKLNVYAVDMVGNQEEAQAFGFSVDLTPPTTTRRTSGQFKGNILSVRAQIRLEAKDNIAGVKRIYYKLDDGSEKRYNDQVDFYQLDDGSHTLTFYSVDKVGNKEAEQTFEFYLDKTPPVVDATIVGDQYQNRGRIFISDRSNVELEAQDNKAGISKVYYRVDVDEDLEYKKPFPLKKSQGSHVVLYYAEDEVGNIYEGKFREENSGRKGLDLDMEAPEIDNAYDGPFYSSRDTVFITRNTSISLSAKDNDSGIKAIGYKVNGSKGISYDEPFKMEEEGVYEVDYYGTDYVNNRNSKEFYFVVDNTGPELVETLSMEPIGKISLDDLPEDLKVYSSGVKIYLAATDGKIDTEDIFYSVDGGEQMKYANPIVVNQRGIVNVKATAYDYLRNEASEPVDLTIFVK